MELLLYTTFDLKVYVAWESRVTFVTVFGDLFGNKCFVLGLKS